MTRDEVLKELESVRDSEAGHYYMGTKAYHQLGEISSDEPDLLFSERETENFYVGAWITGFGFFNVLFPKETTKRLTPEEIERYRDMYVQLNDYEPQKLSDLD